MLVKLYGFIINVISNAIQKLFNISLLRYILFDIIPSSAIIQALITDGVNPVIVENIIKNIVLITLILRFETFILSSKVVSPISNIPCVRP